MDGEGRRKSPVIPSVARDLGGRWLEDRALRHLPPRSLAALGMTESSASSSWHLHPRPVLVCRLTRGVEYLLLREAVFERRCRGQRRALIVVERGAQGSAEEERSGPESTTGRVAWVFLQVAAGEADERLRRCCVQELFAKKAECTLLAMHRDDGRLIGAACHGAEADDRRSAAAQRQVHCREIVRRHGATAVSEGSLCDDRPEIGFHRIDLESEVANRVDEVGSDGSPNPSATPGIAPPVPFAIAVAASRARVANLDVPQRANLVDPLTGDLPG